MKKILRPLLAIICIFTIVSCQKFSANQNSLKLSSYEPGIAANTGSTAFVAMVSDQDTADSPTILGIQLPNPYSIPNMQQAYTNITGQTGTPAVTDLYVRFKLANNEQLLYLD